MKLFLLFICQLFFTTISLAQDPYMNGLHSKYWFYRWRLRNDFMVMGDQPGQSLIIQDRNPERAGLIRFADATLMHGYYLSMLAIEHKILSDLGRTEDLKNNERELYYAMKAVERLDLFAETIYSDGTSGPNDIGHDLSATPQRPCRNGYFFRDDVLPTFLNDSPGTGSSFTSNYYHLNNGKTGIHYGSMNYSKGDYEGLWNHYDPDLTDNEPGYLTYSFLNQPQFPIVNFEKGRDLGEHSIGEESQDQLIRLTLGFEMIVKSIPDQSFYIDKDNDGIIDETYNFHEEAKHNFTNMIGRLNGYFKGTNEVPITEVDHQSYAGLNNSPFPWKIMNARHDKTLGGYIGPFKPPFQAIVPMMFSSVNDLGLDNPSQCIGNITPDFNLLWHTGVSVGYNDYTNGKMALLMNCISNTGNEDFLKTVPRSIYKESKENGRSLHGFYVPLYDYLWGWNPNDSRKGKKDQEKKDESYELANTWLNNAPCIGPHNFAYSYWIAGPNPTLGPYSVDQYVGSGAPPYWNTPFLFDSEYSRYDDGIAHDGNVAEGWFSGVDYMLLYNLIYANADYERPMYHDLINRLVDYEVNSDVSSQLIEYSSNGLLIGAYENMHVKSYIHGNQKLDLKALDFVELNSGTEINPSISGEINIYTDQITCTSGSNTGINDPYKMDICTTCNLEAQTSKLALPTISKKISSLIPEVMPLSMEELFELENIQPTFETIGIEIYPNPTSSSFEIFTNFEFNLANLIDSYGNIVKSFEPIETYDISSVPAGMYTLILTNSLNEKHYAKIIKL